MEQRQTIDAFVRHLGEQKGHPNLTVDRWPDEENRQSKDIDAIAGPFAIEHTSIDSLPNQRRADDWYLQVVGGLDREIPDCVDYGFTVALEFDAIATGMDWKGIRADLKRWILDNASHLGIGTHRITLPTSTPIDPPIEMVVFKNNRSSSVGFCRFDPGDSTLSTRIKTLLDRKASKLMKYQGPSFTTVLLVENYDIALMNEVAMLDAILDAYPDGLPQGADEIWFAKTSIPEMGPRFFDFTGDVANRCH